MVVATVHEFFRAFRFRVFSAEKQIPAHRVEAGPAADSLRVYRGIGVDRQLPAFVESFVEVVEIILSTRYDGNPMRERVYRYSFDRIVPIPSLLLNATTEDVALEGIELQGVQLLSVKDREAK